MRKVEDHHAQAVPRAMFGIPVSVNGFHIIIPLITHFDDWPLGGFPLGGEVRHVAGGGVVGPTFCSERFGHGRPLDHARRGEDEMRSRWSHDPMG